MGSIGQATLGAQAEVFLPGVVSIEGRYEYALSLHPEGDRWIFSAESPEEGAALFHSRLEEGRVISAEPASVGAGGHAFPSPDGSFMLVDSASLNGDGKQDIFVSFRQPDGSWGSLEPLGPEVNTEFSETCPSLSPDGRFLFFSRYNEPDEKSNIYWASADVIPADDELEGD